MAIDAKRRPDVVDPELERLWELPAKSPPGPAPPRRGGIPFARLLGYGWPAVLGGIMLLHPEPHPGAQEWVYTGWFTAGLFLVLGLGLYALVTGHETGALTASVVAGAVGVLLAYECRVTVQHYGNWWAYELVAFGALTTLSLASLAVRGRRHRTNASPTR
jgi:hypothetical protein